MIAKVFIFQFINSYASFFYLAFVAMYVGECSKDTGCMPSLAFNVGVIFFTRYFFKTVTTRLRVPAIQIYLRKKDYLKRMCSDRIPEGPPETVMTAMELEFLKNHINVRKYFFDVYADVVLQIGYISLFASALPMASLYLLLINVIKIKTEPKLWFDFYQRPLPVGCESIGNW
jgi:hypothetical protein